MNLHEATRRICCALIAAILPFTVAHADEVTDWNAIMLTTVARVPDPLVQVRSAAIMQLAVFEAVNAIVGDYDPYLGTLTAPRGASAQSAAVAAAHRTLATLHPDRAAVLDAERAASLAQVADGQPKTDGIAVGEAAALAMLAKRANDRSDTDTLYTPGDRAGPVATDAARLHAGVPAGPGPSRAFRHQRRGAVPPAPAAGAWQSQVHA